MSNGSAGKCEPLVDLGMALTFDFDLVSVFDLRSTPVRPSSAAV